MKLRHLFGGLMAVACLLAAQPDAGATSRVAVQGLDEVIYKSGSPSLIIQGTCTSAKPSQALFPDGKRSLPAVEYVFQDALVIKGNSKYQASNAPQTVTFKMFAGDIADFPRPQVGTSYTLILYGDSAIGLTSVAFGNMGFYPETQVDGQQVVETRGLVFKNKNIEKKFLSRNAGYAKYLGRDAVNGQATTSAESKVTPTILRQAIEDILGGGN
jgi:hypothetical protein